MSGFYIPRYNNNFKIKNKIKLSDMWTASCVDEVGEGSADAIRSLVLGWPTVNFAATFSSPEQKDKRLSLLQRHISLEKEKDYSKSIPFKIFTKVIGNCACSKMITIMPWPAWLSWLNVVPPSERLLVRFPVRAHAWVVGQVPSYGCARGNQSLHLSHISVSLPLFLPSFPSL